MENGRVHERVRAIIAPRSLLRLRPKVFVSRPTRCTFCGELVRLVGENKVGGAWACPACGEGYPYVFWKVRSEGAPRVVTEKELILGRGEEE